MHFIQCYKNWYKNKDPLFYVILITPPSEPWYVCLLFLLFVLVDSREDVDGGEGRDLGVEAPGKQPDVEIEPAQ